MNIIKKIINLHSSIFGLILILSIFLTVNEYFNLKEHNKINNSLKANELVNSEQYEELSLFTVLLFDEVKLMKIQLKNTIYF